MIKTPGSTREKKCDLAPANLYSVVQLPQLIVEINWRLVEQYVEQKTVVSSHQTNEGFNKVLALHCLEQARLAFQEAKNELSTWQRLLLFFKCRDEFEDILVPCPVLKENVPQVLGSDSVHRFDVVYYQATRKEPYDYMNSRDVIFSAADNQATWG